MIEAAVDFFVQSQNVDGGWGAAQDKQSNTEATALALLGLSQLNDPRLITQVDRGLNWLVAQQQADDSWPLLPQLQGVSWPTALVIFSLTSLDVHHERAVRGANWLLQQKGAKGWRSNWWDTLQSLWAPKQRIVELNLNLEGWPWTPNAFSWIEPTAYALIGLKKLRPFLPRKQVEARIRQGELLIYDRMCKGGGWNYGNSIVLGEDLHPYPDTTAVALIALQDQQDSVANQQSLAALQHMLSEVRSGLTLSWSILCFSLYGQDVSEWQDVLAVNYKKTGFLGETKTIALALLASAASTTAFRV